MAELTGYLAPEGFLAERAGAWECYPKRLFALVEKWRAAGTVRRFVCTVKFQGGPTSMRAGPRDRHHILNKGDICYTGTSEDLAHTDDVLRRYLAI